AEADAAVVLVDAREGLAAAVLRDTYVAWLLGVHGIVLAVDASDALADPRHACETVERDYRDYARRIGLDVVSSVPVGVASGVNVTRAGGGAPWYRGPTLAERLAALVPEDPAATRPFRLAVHR